MSGLVADRLALLVVALLAPQTKMTKSTALLARLPGRLALARHPTDGDAATHQLMTIPTSAAPARPGWKSLIVSSGCASILWVSKIV